jgi:hypothetical protein
VIYARQTIGTSLLALLMLSLTPLIGQESTASSSEQKPGVPVPSIFVRVLPHTMEPAMISVEPGPLRIIIQNASTAPNLRLELRPVHGASLKTVSITSSQRHSLETYTLGPGDYVLSEVNHPKWRCRIRVK